MFFSYAQVLPVSPGLTYPMCTDFNSLHEKYNFCPRIEGQHPKGCCPAIKGSRKQCYYAEYRTRGREILINSSYQICENDQSVTVPCCYVTYSSCYVNLTARSFISFLNYREDDSFKGCCYSICPSAAYWADHPNPSLRLPGSYQRLGENNGVNICRSIINRCTNGGGVCLSGQELVHCPIT